MEFTPFSQMSAAAAAAPPQVAPSQPTSPQPPSPERSRSGTAGSVPKVEDRDFRRLRQSATHSEASESTGRKPLKARDARGNRDALDSSLPKPPKGMPAVGETPKVKKSKEEKGNLAEQAAEWWYGVLDWFESADLKRLVVMVVFGTLALNFVLSPLVVVLLVVIGVAALLVGGVTFADDSFAIRLPNEFTPAQLMVGGAVVLVWAMFLGFFAPTLAKVIDWVQQA